MKSIRYLDVHSEDTAMVGDRMDTGIVAGVESGMRTILLLTGVIRRADIERYPYRPTWVLDSVVEIQL
jgi:NagD protein